MGGGETPLEPSAPVFFDGSFRSDLFFKRNRNESRTIINSAENEQNVSKPQIEHNWWGGSKVLFTKAKVCTGCVVWLQIIKGCVRFYAPKRSKPLWVTKEMSNRGALTKILRHYLEGDRELDRLLFDLLSLSRRSRSLSLLSLERLLFLENQNQPAITKAIQHKDHKQNPELITKLHFMGLRKIHEMEHINSHLSLLRSLRLSLSSRSLFSNFLEISCILSCSSWGKNERIGTLSIHQ